MKQHFKFLFFVLFSMLLIPMLALTQGEAISFPVLQDKQEEYSQFPLQKDANHNHLSSDTEEETITVFLCESEEILTLKMSDYIKSVVCAEMPASFSEEAIKAQTVLAHTYALRILKTQQQESDPSLHGAQISDDPDRHQAYLPPEKIKKLYGKNYDTYWKKISTCADAVINQILTYEEEPIVAAFHAISRGYTESAENVWGQQIPYLIPADSEGDPLSPHYEDTVSLSKEKVLSSLKKQFPKLSLPDDPTQWFQILSTTKSGYVKEISVGGQTLNGMEFRSLFSLKSADFSISYQDGTFTFTTHGYGHGVGMSQYGADYFAKQGKTYQEILSHYFPGTTLISISKKEN